MQINLSRKLIHLKRHPLLQVYLKRLKKGMKLLSNAYCKPYIDMLFVSRAPQKGYIVCQEQNGLSTYQEFHPYLFEQFKNQSIIEYDSFDLATDEFFSKIESQKLELRARQAEATATKKLDAAKEKHEKHLTSLESAQVESRKNAETILAHVDLGRMNYLIR